MTLLSATCVRNCHQFLNLCSQLCRIFLHLFTKTFQALLNDFELPSSFSPPFSNNYKNWQAIQFSLKSNLSRNIFVKVRILWEGHKVLRNLHLVSTVHTDKRKVEIWQNFVAFSEYMNFNKAHQRHKSEQNTSLCSGAWDSLASHPAINAAKAFLILSLNSGVIS